MNGQYGIVRSDATSGGRLGVEIFAREKDGQVYPPDYALSVSLRSSNLDAIDAERSHRLGFRVLEMYLSMKPRNIFRNEGPSERGAEILRELFAIPG